jgi:anti-sigma B factor antagonist
MEFKYTVEEKTDHAIVHFAGRLMDKQSAAPLIEQFEGLLKNNGNKVVFDLNKLEYMNSSGLNILVNFLTKSRNHGGDIAIAAVTEKISQLLVITKLNTLFKIHPDVSTAVASFSKN